MINGVDALKELAYRVTEYSNDEDGVAKTVEKILKASGEIPDGREWK